MIRVEHSVVIRQPVETVFTFLSDVTNIPRWNSVITESKLTSEGPVQVGATFYQVANFLGRRIQTELRVTEYEPNKVFAFKSISGPFPIMVKLTLEPVGDSTNLSHFGEPDASGFFKLAEPLLSIAIKRQVESNMSHLKNLLEASP